MVQKGRHLFSFQLRLEWKRAKQREQQGPRHIGTLEGTGGEQGEQGSCRPGLGRWGIWRMGGL